MVTDAKLQQLILTKFVSLKDSISKDFLEKVITDYCHANRMVLPSKEGTNGVAVLKIVEVMMLVNKVGSVFELLDQEEAKLMDKYSNSEDDHPINVLTNTRLINQKLDKTFYKEQEPFMKDDICWSLFAWRINASLSQPKYTNGKFEENDQ